MFNLIRRLEILTYPQVRHNVRICGIARTNLRLTLLFVALIVLVSCSTTEVTGNARVSSSIASGEGIAVLSATLPKGKTYDQIDEGVDDCIGARLRSAHPEWSIVPANEVRRAFYPYPYSLFEVDPQLFDKIKKAVQEPEGQRKVAELHLRFIVFVNISKTGLLGDVTHSGDLNLGLLHSEQGGLSHGGVFCGGGGPGAGCLGLMAWDIDADIQALVIDVNDLREPGTIAVSAKGHGIMPALVLPVPIPLAMPGFSACSAMAKELAARLAQENEKSRSDGKP